MSGSTSRDPRPLILHVVHRFDVGGLEVGLVKLLNELPETRWRHTVLALTEVSAQFCERVTRRDVEYIALGKRPGHLHRLYPRLVRLMRQQSPAIVHTRNLAALEAVVPAWWAGVPVRIHGEHGRDVRDPRGGRVRFRWVRRAYAPFVSRYVALSGDLESYLTDAVGIAPARIVRICNGVDTDHYGCTRHRADTVADVPFTPDRHWVVGTVGRLDPVKDQTTLARAFVRALEIRPGARAVLRLMVVGDGALRGEIERILAEHDASKLAWLAGERSDVPALMARMNCFVLPSLGEGISNTILEAMASALPVIATRVGGNAELVEDGTTGVLVPPADADALAQAILTAYDRPHEAAARGAAGRERAVRCFSLRGMIARYDDLYSEAIERAGLSTVRADDPRLGRALRS